MAVHYDFLVHFAPRDAKVRPFVSGRPGGVQNLSWDGNGHSDSTSRATRPTHPIRFETQGAWVVGRARRASKGRLLQKKRPSTLKKSRTSFTPISPQRSLAEAAG